MKSILTFLCLPLYPVFAPAQTAGSIAMENLIWTKLRDLLATYSKRDFATQGASENATQSNATFGRGILGVKMDAALRQIKQAI